MDRNIWLDGMMGLIVGDALGVPVQFMEKEEITTREVGPVRGMESGGVYNMPAGTWSDDGSMVLATLDSIVNNKRIDLTDIMECFCKWELEGKYTQYGEAFDQGNTCTEAIYRYIKDKKIDTCGCTGENSNGNGSLMRILPACIFLALAQETAEEDKMALIHKVSGLTHNHLRSKMACGLYYAMVDALLHHRDKSSLKEVLQTGIDNGLKFYGKDRENYYEMTHFTRLFHLDELQQTEERDMRSGGYVIETIEAAVWCLITTDSLKECLLKVVNMGHDTDTVAAVAGGLAGLYYGADAIPKDWLDEITKKEYVEELCEKASLLCGSKAIFYLQRKTDKK
ncbi:ADP-ribosylglycohydrolase family protein [Roseburia sp. 499]|uniref:ADP-ribosylglycohydrolase family protein n=1 Tax=Roseburia sp. 499 TaxID=1261634 RepID=UPI000950D78C|nr:ADP-ribosylglycohydrolase family protein [Roseburia sp. 499]WVK69029.1 ADP-ribosylglycohydrolase family protein [Roseburia sp. 499]